MEDPFSHNQRDFHGLGFHDSSVGKESTCNAEDPRSQFNFWVGKNCWRRDRLSTPVFLGFSCGSAGKESACNVGDLSFIPGLGRSGEGKGYPLQNSGLENSTDYSPWGCKESDTTEWLSLSLWSLPTGVQETPTPTPTQAHSSHGN